jgi:Nuclease-related domain
MPARSSLRGRIPGQAVMSEIVAAQQSLPPRSMVARIFGLPPLTRTTRALYRAALGELVVGEALDHLGSEWDVLHVVPLASSGTEIDHLVIGPPGVFAITTESFPGEVLKVTGETLQVGARNPDDIRAATLLAESAEELLAAAAGKPVSVKPLMVVVNSTKLVLREQPAGLTVVSARHLVRWLKSLERTLAGTDVAFTSDIAERTTTWQTDPETPENTLQLHDDFETLRAQVDDAAKARIFWGIIGLGVLSAVIWASTAMLLSELARR